MTIFFAESREREILLLFHAMLNLHELNTEKREKIFSYRNDTDEKENHIDREWHELWWIKENYQFEENSLHKIKININEIIYR